jgi:hypothetical protein
MLGEAQDDTARPSCSARDLRGAWLADGVRVVREGCGVWLHADLTSGRGGQLGGGGLRRTAACTRGGETEGEDEQQNNAPEGDDDYQE